mgnify:CR=1 FL=1
MQDDGVSILCDIACELGEGPSYDPQSGKLFWFDIVGRKLLERPFPDGPTAVHDLPFMASAIAFAEGGMQLLVAENGVPLRDPKTGALTLHTALEANNPKTRSNDARVHPSGAFWIGTMAKDEADAAGAIYWFREGEVRTLYPGISIPNSICFSPDGRIAYFADTPRGILYRVECDPATGMPTGEPRTFLDWRGREGFIDGSVVDAEGRVVGIVTNRDMRFASDDRTPVSVMMTSDRLAMLTEPADRQQAIDLMKERRIEKLLVVDDSGRCVGLITVKDIEKAVTYPNATKDSAGRLCVAAATTVGDKGFERTEALIDAEVDVVVIDTAHGHNKDVARSVERVKKLSNSVQVIAGNIATYDGARALYDAGADCVKVGIGPGSICTTRIVAGVGVPQLTAIEACANAAQASGVPVIADPLDDLPSGFDQLASTQSNIGRMVKAGVRVAINAAAMENPRNLNQYAGNLVALTRIPGADGLSWGQAFAAISSVPAAISGVGGKAGVLAPGAMGDLVIWDGDPLEVGSVPVKVFIDGVEQPLDSHQSRLRERYRDLDLSDLPKAYDW